MLHPGSGFLLGTLGFLLVFGLNMQGTGLDDTMRDPGAVRPGGSAATEEEAGAD